MSTDQSHRRAVPAQRRSAETVDLILRVSLELLDSHGLQAFNTNAVAAKARINVGTVYHYYPDKNAILRQLFERHELQRSEWVAGRLEELVDTDDVHGWVNDVLKGIVRIRRSTPGTRVLRTAIRAVPELQEIEESIDRRSVRILSDVIRRRYTGITRQRATAAARVIVETSTTVLDRADDFESSPASIVRELAELLSAYLESLSDG